MNYKCITYILGWILKVEGVFLALPLAVSLLYRERTWPVFLACALLSLVLGTALSFKRPENFQFYAREGYVGVALGWIVMSLVGALPFYFTGEIPSFTDSLFEIISGFTTTGASILPRVEDLSNGILIWRSFSHWIGGMGVLVFVLQIMPMTSGQTMHLMRAESPGPSVSKLVPRIRTTAFFLYGIYVMLTVLEIILLLLGRLPMFDAVCTAFGTAGTGGFGIRSDSIAGYSPYVQVVVTIFMMLFGTNFAFYYLIIARKLKDAFCMEEVKLYFGIFAAATLLITINILSQIGNVGDSLRHAAFQVASIMTTTGFATADFDKWPEFSKGLLVVLMFIGACAGSTGGGLKVSRVIILLKSVKKELFSLLHPRSVKIIKIESKPVEHQVIRSINTFLVAYLVIFVLSTVIVSLDNFDFTTNFTAVAATFNNIGPGLGAVGPTGNFSGFSAMSKWVMMFDMLAGRLEVFPMLLLFAPSTWKK